jgi:precorrin-6B methylase 2
MNGGEYNPILKQQLTEKIIRKASNVFWYYVDYLSFKLEKFANLYELSISQEYDKESELFDIKDDNNILHIGCGAYPITAITLTRNNGVKVTAIDRSKKAVERAKFIINKKNLDKRISIQHGDGTNYPVEKFDTIIISGCAIPRIKILKHIFETAKSKSKIIVREMDSGAKLVNNLIRINEDINLVKKIKSRPLSFFDPMGWQSFYLIKK